MRANRAMSFRPTTLLVASLCGYATGAVGGLWWMRRDKLANVFSFGAASLSSLSGVLAALWFLTSGVGTSAPQIQLLPTLIPYIRFTVRLDPLGALFVLIVSLLGFALSTYSIGYAKGFYGRKNIGVLGAFFNALLLATTLTFVANNIWLFLIAWEIMALTAYCLVSFEHEKPETRKAGVLFFIMSHIDAGCIMLGFLLLFQASGDYGFATLHEVGARMSPGKRDAAFVLFLLGFGIKAGIVPLHVWLPAAHPVAPSNVSALMSGVLYALMEHDLKRLLAYHSIENIGIILMGLGTALTFLYTGHPRLATLGLIAGLYHTLNHASFKGLLFLGAGAVLHSTHTRNMEEMGGLAKRMPQTTLFFLIGAVAISALPPLNGFVSEWLTYQTLLQGFGTTDSLWRLIYPLSGAMLAMTGALAAACFVKAFGITFLGQPRSREAEQAQEAAPSMRLGMAVLTAACVVLGLWPTGVVRLLDPLTQQLTAQQLSGQLTLANGLVLTSLAESTGTVSTLGLVLARNCRTRRGPTWACGQRELTPQMQYTATGFSKPIRMIFKALFRPRREVQREYDYSPYFAKNLRFESHIEEAFVTRIYRPLNRGILRLSRRMRALQAGSIQAYLIYIFITLLVLLMFAL